MENIFQFHDITALIVSYLNFSDMASLSRTNTQIRKIISSIHVYVGGGSGKSGDDVNTYIRGQTTQYNFRKIAMEYTLNESHKIGLFAKILLKYGTPVSTEYILKNSPAFLPNASPRDILSVFLSITTGQNDIIDVVIDMLMKISSNIPIEMLGKNNIDVIDDKAISASALFAGNKYYFGKYMPIARPANIRQDIYGNSVSFGLFPVNHMYDPLTPAKALEIAEVIRNDPIIGIETANEIMNEIMLYSDDVRKYAKHTLPTGIKLNIITLNQKNNDIFDIISRLFVANDPHIFFLKFADFTCTDFGKDVFRNRYKKHPDFIHGTKFRVTIGNIERTFPDIFSREIVCEGLERLKKSALFHQIFEEKYEWLCDESEIRGNRKCISERYVHHVVADIFQYIDYIGTNAIIRHMEYYSIYWTTYGLPRVLTLSLIPEIMPNNGRVSATIRRILDKIIENNIPYYMVTSPRDMKEITEKFGINLSEFVNMFQEKNIHLLSEKDKFSHDNFVKKCMMFL